MRVEVEIGTVEISAVHQGVTVERLRAALVRELKARIGTTSDAVEVGALSYVTDSESAGQTNQDHLATAIAGAIAGGVAR